MASKPTSQLILLLIFILGVTRVRCKCDNMTSISAQLDILLAEYDRGMQNTPTMHVTAALDIYHATINERAATVRLLAALYLKWEDKRLAWNGTSWGCDSALVSAERLWLPDVGVLSAATSAGTGEEMELRARVTSDGRVSWIIRLDLVSPVALDLTAWPTDIQEVSYKIGSRSHFTQELNLTLSNLEHATVFESGAWELLLPRQSETTWKVLDMEQNVLVWTVSLQRRAAGHALATKAVLAGCIIMLIAVAMVPPASRTALCATAAFTAALWLISALTRLPGASSSPRVLSLMSVCCVCAACAAAGAALVLRVARCSSPPPHALRSLLTSVSAFCKLGPPEGSDAECSAWAAAAQLLDYVLLAAMFITLFVVMCLSF